jgi:hypothetical protein
MATGVTKPQRPVNNSIFKSDPQTLPDFLIKNIHKVNTLLPLPDPLILCQTANGDPPIGGGGP